MMPLVQIALRNVLRNRRRTFITLAALFVGVSVMISIRGLLNGLQLALVNNVTSGQVGAVQVHREGYMKNVLSTPIHLDFKIADVLPYFENVEFVKAVAPRIQFGGMVSSGDETVFFSALALDQKMELQVCPLRTKVLTSGSSFIGEKVPNGFVLSANLAQAIKLQKDQEAVILTNDREGSLSGELVRLVGTMELGLPGEMKIGMLPLDVAQRLLKMEGRATEIALRVEPIDKAAQVAESLRQRLPQGFEVHTWDTIATFVRTALARQNFILGLISSGFMFLMLLGVANTMLMSVLERTREIGTMMAMGLTRAKIVALFLVEALLLGLVGGLLGSSVGMVVVSHLGRRGIEMTAPGSKIPFVITPTITLGYVLFVVGVATAGAVLFALYPARRASRLRPVEALAGK